MVTASKVLVLNTTGDYLWSVPYYDKEGKPIRTFSQHYVGGAPALSLYNYDDISTIYTFLKQIKKVTRKHYISNTGKTASTLFLTVMDSSTYDHMGRLLATYQQLKDKAATAQKKIVLSLNTYNEIGQLAQKSLHSFDNGSKYMQKVNYRYNARGWLTNINNPSLQSDSGLTNNDTNDQFGMELKYDDATTATPQYNGNIATATTYMPKMASAIAANIPLTYDYTYDKINRLSSAVSTSSTPKDGLYNENLQYNTMGDITKLNRYENTATGRQAIDSLNYTYTGTKLIRIIDSAMYTGSAGFKASTASTQYLYDGNGNQTKDNNKTLSTAWNMLNLPQLVTFTNGNTIAYVYDALGKSSGRSR